MRARVLYGLLTTDSWCVSISKYVRFSQNQIDDAVMKITKKINLDFNRDCANSKITSNGSPPRFLCEMEDGASVFSVHARNLMYCSTPVEATIRRDHDAPMF